MYLLSMMSKKHSYQDVLATLSIIALLKNSKYQVFPFKLMVLNLWRDLRNFELSGFELSELVWSFSDF